jgi:iron complex outermembrane receptor protein
VGDALYVGIDPNDPRSNPESRASFDVIDRAVGVGRYVVTLIDEPGQTLDFDDTNVRLNLAYKPNDQTLVYASYSDAFKSGGFNPRYLAPTSGLRAISFDPESVEAFELGYKFSGDKFRANLALFYSDYSDIQISADSPSSAGATVTQNAAAASISGVEVEFTYVPSGNWLLEAGFGYLDAEYDELGSRVSSGVSLDSRFPRIPEFTGNVGASYIQSLAAGSSLSYRVDASYRGDSEGTVQNDPQAFQDSYSIVNAGVFYNSANQKWRVSAGVSNVTDEEYSVSVNVNQRLGYAEGVFARGREFYISAEYLFGQ